MGTVRNWLRKLGLLPGIRRSCVMVGLNGAGKTSIAQYLARNDDPPDTTAEPLPTVGLDTETIRRDSFTLTLFDMSGNPRQRTLWPHYLASAHAVVFVVDATDKDRVEIARRELHQVLHQVVSCGSEQEPSRTKPEVPILILCNKMDCEDQAMSPAELAGLLGLDAFRQHNWYLSGCSAWTGRGLNEGFGWLLEQLELMSEAPS